MPAEAASERTLRVYIDEVAAGTPTPGGGSVAAVVGALAAALGEMVANLTLGREQYVSAEEGLRPARERLTALRMALVEAAGVDEAAYAAYRRAAALPRRSADEKSARMAAMQEALLAATEAPLGVARAGAEIAAVLETVATSGNPHVRSDTALGALLAEAALRGALLNVRGNAALLRDDARARVYQDEADRLEKMGREAAERAFRFATGGSADAALL
jgi:formiminotetrahydrofolate cyclodeaminase